MRIQILVAIIAISLTSGNVLPNLRPFAGRFAPYVKQAASRFSYKADSFIAGAKNFSTLRPSFKHLMPGKTRMLSNKEQSKISFLSTFPRFSNEERTKWQKNSNYLYAWSIPGLAAVLSSDKEKTEEISKENEQQKATSAPLKEPLIKLPDVDTLAKRLDATDFKYFNEKTGLAKNLGDREVYADGIIITIEYAISDFEEYLKKSSVSESTIDKHLNIIRVNYARLIKLILKDSPEAIEYLKQSEFLKEIGVSL